MAVDFNLLKQSGPANFFEGLMQGQEEQRTNAMAQQRAMQAQQEFGMRQQEFAAGQAEKKRLSSAAIVLQKTASAKDAMLRAPTSADARRIVEMQYADPDLSPVRSRFGSLAQALAEIPDDPNAFQQYKEQEAMGMEAFLKQQSGNRAFTNAMGGTPTAAPANVMYAQSEAYPTYNESIGMGAAPANAMAAAPTAPANELQRLIDRRNNLSAISDQTPRVKANIENLNKDIERLSKTKEKINVIGVAKGTGNPVYLDSISDEQYIYVADADGKQKRKLYSGPVDRTTSNVTATANAKLPPLESAEQKGKGELNVNLYKVISDTARLATKTLPALETQAKILDSGFNTGFGTAAQKAGASVLSALGVPEATKFATDAQTFLAATQQAVLQKQLEQKGPQTESDAKRITDTGAQLGNTVDANRFIINVAKAQFKRDLNQRDFFDKWWAKNTTYEGAENAWFGGEGGKSLFDAPELTKYVASKRSEADAILKRK